MTRIRQCTWLVMCLLTGCVSGPRVDNPSYVGSFYPPVENPVLIAPGEPSPYAYAEVFEHILDVVDDDFEIAYANRYDGRILTQPTIAPGMIQFWRPGSPSARERLLASLQSIRYRGEIQIQAAAQGGYLVEVRIFKELLDAPRPIQAAGGPAAFREAPTVERQFQVVEPKSADKRWIRGTHAYGSGREVPFEQRLLRKIQLAQ